MRNLCLDTWSSEYAEYFLELFYRQNTVLVIVEHFKQLLKFIKICLIYSEIF